MSSRIIGIQHRVKKTVEGESRPTIVVITENGLGARLELESEVDELDFLQGELPTKWRKVILGEDLSGFEPWHIKKDKKTGEPTQVPTAYEGFKPDDTVVMALGGSGDYFAYGLAKKGEEIGAKVLRIAPFKLQAERGEGKKEDDAELFVKLYQEKPALFEESRPRDMAITRVRVAVRRWLDAMQDRIAAGNRFRSAFIGRLFTNPKGVFPVGGLEKAYVEEKAANPGLQALEGDEAEAMSALKKALGDCDIWHQLFLPIKGVGPSIGGRIISAIMTITRFATAPKLRAYCGVHVMDDGRFPRRRNKEVANWSGTARQALFLLGDQFNRRPDTAWGKRLIANKVMYRQKHPEKVKQESGKLKYTDAHIHKMALWRTLSEFVDWLFESWWNIEKSEPVVEPGEWFAERARRRVAYNEHQKSIQAKPKGGAGDVSLDVAA